MDSQVETQDTTTTDNNPKDMVSLLQAIQGELNLLRTELKRKDDKIESLEKRIEDMEITHKEEMRHVKNEICDLKERALNTEMYLSKDTIIINNPPACNNTNIMDTVVGFFNEIFGARVQPEDIKAVHFLGKPGESAIIVKFLYFGQKNFIWRSKKVLRDFKNPINNKPYFLTERLPPMCRDLFNAAKEKGIRVVTNNSEVQLVCKGQGEKAVFRPIHTLEDLEKVAPLAFKFTPAVGQIENGRNFKTVKRENDRSSSGLTPENKVSCPVKSN